MKSGFVTFFFWICLCQHLESIRTGTYNTSFLFPTNVTWKILNYTLHVYWECNVPKEIQNDVVYEVTMHNPVIITQKIQTSDRHVTLDLYPNTTLMVTTIKDERDRYDSEEIIVFPEGLHGTAAENVSFLFSSDFNTSVTCSWNYGKNAPNDTVYTLILRQSEGDMRCKRYIHDEKKRMANCTIPNLNINFLELTCIIIEGSSKEKIKEKIQMFVTYIKPSEEEIISPPTNIHLSCTSKQMEINWTKPSMLSDLKDDCFIYMIAIDEAENGPFQTYSYAVPIENLRKDSKLKIRAKNRNQLCGLGERMGEWSKPIPYCNVTGYVNNKIDMVLITTIVAVGVLLTIIGLHLWCKCLQDKFFPPIPKPKLNFDFEHYYEWTTTKNGTPKNHTLNDGPLTVIEEVGW